MVLIRLVLLSFDLLIVWLFFILTLVCMRANETTVFIAQRCCNQVYAPCDYSFFVSNVLQNYISITALYII